MIREASEYKCVLCSTQILHYYTYHVFSIATGSLIFNEGSPIGRFLRLFVVFSAAAPPPPRDEIGTYLRAAHSTATLDSARMRASASVSAVLFPPSGSSDIRACFPRAYYALTIIFMAPGFSSDAPLTLATAATVRRELAQAAKALRA